MARSEAQTETDAQAPTRQAELSTVDSTTTWGHPDPSENAVSLNQLQLAEFYGDNPNPVAQEHVKRLEDFLRSHAVGGSNRKSEGYYGPKTRELVQAASEKYTGQKGNGTVSPQLLDALKVAGLETST